jgi:alkanesulfonate monooxygenase SsuD/methylene tetrahydromethanopterin reductase-like flavin-dependent oxidoreductase (luciferase family)
MLAGHSLMCTFSLNPEVEKWTADRLADEIKLGGMGPVVCGSPSTVADKLQHWIDVADADGFNFCYATTPGTFEDIVRPVCPD